MFEYAQLVADMLKGIAWPFAIYLIVRQFQSEVKALVPRIIKGTNIAGLQEE